MRRARTPSSSRDVYNTRTYIRGGAQFPRTTSPTSGRLTARPRRRPAPRTPPACTPRAAAGERRVRGAPRGSPPAQRSTAALRAADDRADRGRGLHAAEADDDRARGAGSTLAQAGSMEVDTIRLHPQVEERGRTERRGGVPRVDTTVPRVDTTVPRCDSLGALQAAARTGPGRLEVRQRWGHWCRRRGVSSARQRKRDRTRSGWRRERRRRRWGWGRGWAGRRVSRQAAAALGCLTDCTDCLRRARVRT